MSHFVEGSFKSFVASYDFTVGGTVTAPTFLAVKLDTNGQITPATSATDPLIIGVLYDLPKIGQNGNVRLRSAAGTTNIQLGATVAAGAAVTIDNTSRGITTTTAGNQLMGTAIEAGIVGQVIEMIPNDGKY